MSVPLPLMSNRFVLPILSLEIWLIMSGFGGSIYARLFLIKPLRKQQNGGEWARMGTDLHKLIA
jgi:hypothetical protein